MERGPWNVRGLCEACDQNSVGPATVGVCQKTYFANSAATQAYRPVAKMPQTCGVSGQVCASDVWCQLFVRKKQDIGSVSLRGSAYFVIRLSPILSQGFDRGVGQLGNGYRC